MKCEENTSYLSCISCLEFGNCPFIRLTDTISHCDKHTRSHTKETSRKKCDNSQEYDIEWFSHEFRSQSSRCDNCNNSFMMLWHQLHAALTSVMHNLHMHKQYQHLFVGNLILMVLPRKTIMSSLLQAIHVFRLHLNSLTVHNK